MLVRITNNKLRMWVSGLPLALLVCVASSGCQTDPFGGTMAVPLVSDDRSHWEQYGPTTSDRLEQLDQVVGSSTVGQQTVDKLVQQIAVEPDPLVRKKLLAAISSQRSPLSEEVLKAGLSDESPDVRIACCELLAQRGGPQVATLLSGVLRSESDVDVRIAAAKALGSVSDSTSIQALHETMQDEDPALRRRAAESLAKITGDQQIAWQNRPAGATPSGTPSFAERMIYWWR